MHIHHIANAFLCRCSQTDCYVVLRLPVLENSGKRSLSQTYVYLLCFFPTLWCTRKIQPNFKRHVHFSCVIENCYLSWVNAFCLWEGSNKVVILFKHSPYLVHILRRSDLLMFGLFGGLRCIFITLQMLSCTCPQTDCSVVLRLPVLDNSPNQGNLSPLTCVHLRWFFSSLLMDGKVHQTTSRILMSACRKRKVSPNWFSFLLIADLEYTWLSELN